MIWSLFSSDEIECRTALMISPWHGRLAMASTCMATKAGDGGRSSSLSATEVGDSDVSNYCIKSMFAYVIFITIFIQVFLELFPIVCDHLKDISRERETCRAGIHQWGAAAWSVAVG